jgi:ribosome-associated translation inhibitor RaiA
MELRVKGTRYEPTPEILSQAEKQIQPLGRFLGKDYTEALASLELSQEVGGQQKGDIWRAELTVDHEGRRYRAESLKAKLSHAITTVARDVGRELRRAKGKDEALFKRGTAAVKDFVRGFGRQ